VRRGLWTKLGMTAGRVVHIAQFYAQKIALFETFLLVAIKNFSHHCFMARESVAWSG
jgi:hypothetical protein